MKSGFAGERRSASEHKKKPDSKESGFKALAT
jgi:hypothetical protein